MTTTAYLDLFLRSISEPALLEIFLRFILLHQHENVHILDTLTSRINTPFRVRRAPEEGSLQLRTDFRRVCFGNEIMNILFCSVFFFLVVVVLWPLPSFYLVRDEWDNVFCSQGSFCQRGDTYCLSQDIFCDFSVLVLLQNQQNALLWGQDAGEHVDLSSDKAKEPECIMSGYQRSYSCP